jgi:hypothetical protein
MKDDERTASIYFIAEYLLSCLRNTIQGQQILIKSNMEFVDK